MHPYSVSFGTSSRLPPRVAHRATDPHGRDAHGRDAAEEVDDLLLVVGKAVGVEVGADGGVLRFLLFVLVEDPLERRAVAEPVLPGLRRNAREGGLAVEHDA